MSKTNYADFKASLPEAVRSDKRQLLAVARAAGVEVPLEERFYLTTHTPKRTRDGSEPAPTEYVAIPNPVGGRDFWVRKSEFGNLVNALINFGVSEGLIDRG